MNLSMLHGGGILETAIVTIEFATLGLAAWLCHKIWGL